MTQIKKEEIIGIFKYCAEPSCTGGSLQGFGHGGARTIFITIVELIFTDLGLLIKDVHHKDSPEVPALSNLDMIKGLLSGVLGGKQWVELKNKVVPVIDSDKGRVTKDILKAQGYWPRAIYNYDKISKLRIDNTLPHEWTRPFLNGDLCLSIYSYSLSDELATELYITKKSLPLLVKLIKETPLASKLEIK